MQSALTQSIDQDQVMAELDKTNPALSIKPENIVDPRTQRDIAIIREARNIPPGIKTDDWYGTVAAQYRVSKATVYRKLSDASIRKRFDTAAVYNPVNSRSYCDEAVSYAIGRYLAQPRIVILDLYNELKNLSKEKDWKIGSVQALYRIIQAVPAPMQTFSIGGRRAVEYQYMPKIKRDLSVYHVMEMIVGDQHLFDYCVLGDDGEVFTPEMYAWIDQRSRYWVGVFPSFGHYSSADIGLSLKAACRWGIPKSIYTDNGKPELSRYVDNVLAQLSGLSISNNDDGIDSDSGIRHIKAKPRTPRSKIIESHFWHGMEALLMRKNLPGYCKRAFNDFENEQRQKQVRDLKASGQLLHYKEFWQEVLKTVQDANRRQLTTEDIVPETYFFENLKSAPLVRFDDRTLDLIFLPAERRKVRESCVSITINGQGRCRYYGRELSALSGREVEIRFNPYEHQSVYVIDPQSHELICIAELEQQINPKDQDQVREKIRRYSSIANFWVEQSNRFIKQITREYPLVLSPYNKPAAQIQERKQREEAAVSDEETNRLLLERYDRDFAQAN